MVLAGASTSARRLIAAYPVVVRPGGIRVYGLRGGPAIDSHWIEWAAIARAHRFYVPFILCLVLHTRAQQRFWIPLDLAGAPRLRQLVYAHAGRAHALARALSG